MKYLDIKERYSVLLSYIDDEQALPYKKGCIKNFLRYIKRKSRESVKIKDNKLYVPDSLITEEYITNYLCKNDHDYDAKDCVHIALNHAGVPPVEELSFESLSRTARDIMKQLKDNVYIKRTKGNATTFCVDYRTALKIASHPDLVRLIDSQTKKAEKSHKDTVAWRAYEFEKEKIAYLDALDSQASEDEFCHSNLMNTDTKTFLMVKAIFNKFFSDFDFQKYEEYLNEMESLYDDWSFGKRYQELYDIFHSPHFNYEFYQEIKQNDFEDIIADKVAEKIIAKMEND